MTPSQISLLKQLIDQNRRFWLRHLEDEPVHYDERGVEVGGMFGCDPRTATSLVRAGLAETVTLWPGHTRIFLGRYSLAPLDSGEGGITD